MKVKVRRVGNSLTVTIPKEIALDVGIGPDTEVDVSIRGQQVVMEPIESRWERLVKDAQQQLAERGLTESDIDVAVAEIRGRPNA